MKKLVPVFGLLCLIATSSAWSYQKDAHTEELLRQALSKSKRSELAQCALKNGTGLVIQNAGDYMEQAEKCLAQENKNLSRECLQIENSAGSVDGYDSGEDFVRTLKAEMSKNLARVEQVITGFYVGEALLLTDLQCGEIQVSVSSAIRGEGEKAQLRILEIKEN